MAIGDLYRMTIESHYSGTGIKINNLLHFVENVDHGITGAFDLGADWAVHVGGSTSTAHGGYKALLAPTYTVDQVRVQRLAPTLDPPVVTPYSPVLSGTNGLRALPAICAMTLQLRGLRAGRSGAGRLYLGGYAVAINLDEGKWDNGFSTTVETSWRSVLSRYSGSFDWLWVVYSAKLGGRRPYNALGATPITSMAVDRVVRLERSREFGVSRRHAGRH